MKILKINNTYSNNINFNARQNIFVKGYDRLTDGLAIGMGKVMNTNAMQNFADKFYTNKNVATHIFSATGILLSTFFILSTARNPKIEQERKKPLMLNTAIASTFATIGGYTIDKALNKPIDKFVKTFETQNASNPNLHKYLTGIRVAKSALVFGLLYKFVVPVISTFLAEKYVEKH